MASATPAQRWHIPFNESLPDDLPAQWASAITAVSNDLRVRRHGRMIGFEHVAWVLTANTDGCMHIGMATSSEGADLSPFVRGAGFAVDATAAQAAVWLAETIQEELAGYEFVQWPIDGKRLLSPKLNNAEAVWVDSVTDTAFAPIGCLGGEPHSGAP